MDKPEIPWLYLAMVAIIFVRWLMAQFRKAAAKRRDYRRNLRRRWDNPEPEPPRPVVVPPIPESRTVEDVPRQPESVPQTLQELFEMRRKEIAEAQRKLSPPPIPVKAPEPVEPEVVVPRAKPVVVKAPPAKPVRRKRSIAATLKNPNELRRALVLKEVLDKPKGFDL
ncbi:MAG: hypothetical protein P1U89_13455 [Verrucomicrobiales bacterium]|nr:hypothetical protein [Verrucomicrobiales bacterium]